MGFEPTTASLEGWNSTTELRPPVFIPTPSNSAVHFTTVPNSSHKPLRPTSQMMVGRQGFEPWKPMATDLQSAPFGHLGNCPKSTHRTIYRTH